MLITKAAPEIVLYPNPILRQIAERMDPDSKDLPDLIDNMTAAMVLAGGIGIAAPQIGVSKRVIILKLSRGPKAPFKGMIMINPEISDRSPANINVDEGCLSIPGVRVRMSRSEWVGIFFDGLDGVRQKETLEGIESVVLQHEIDHLDGKLIIDGILRGELPPNDSGGGF